MSDNNETVKSKISMNLKDRNKNPNTESQSTSIRSQEAREGAASTSTTKSRKSLAAEEDLNFEKRQNEQRYLAAREKQSRPQEEQLRAREDQNGEKDRDTGATPASAINSQMKPAETIRTSNNSLNNKLLTLALSIILFVVLGAVALSYYEGYGHYYYVESTIALPSESETETTALSLGACVQDYTKEATPKELTVMLHNEYNYSKKADDLVQTLVSTGCDKSLPLPKIKNGSFFGAIF